MLITISQFEPHCQNKRIARSWQVQLLILTLLLISFSGVAQAHSRQENYVWLNVETDHLSGRFEVHIDDVKDKLGIDVDAAGIDREAGVLNTAAAMQAYFLQNFGIEDQGNIIELEFLEAGVFEEARDYLQYPFRTSRLPDVSQLTITNSIWLTPQYMKGDRLHRSLLVVEYNKELDKEFGSENVALVFGPEKTVQQVDLTGPQPILQWKDFLGQGLRHILIGYDHILFIIVLLLTVVLRYKNREWEPMDGLRPAFVKTLTIVTLFTIAHSITLTLAALNFVSVNSTIVESIIALSIVAVAVNNIFPRYSAHSWVLVFIFGLFHGLGFASVMGDLQFRNVLIERILIMFNVGVELGQLAIVCVVFPCLFLLRKWKYYEAFVVRPVSAVAIIVALIWLLDRVGLIG